MNFYHEKNHPNGFKIILASKISNSVLKKIAVSADTRNGAQLEFTSSNGLSFKLDPNSAVLKIMQNSFDAAVLAWIDWDICLQESLIPYLQGISSKKSVIKNVQDSLSDRLLYLNSSIVKSKQYLLGKLTAADVVIYCTLLPLLASPLSLSFLQTYQTILDYMNFLRSQEVFKEAEISYFGPNGVSLDPWLSNQLPLCLSEVSTLSLVKGIIASNTIPSLTSEKDCDVTDENIAEAKSTWEKDSVVKIQSSANFSKPVLPVKGERNILITSALPYVNNVPHLGNIIGCVLSADCFARFCRLRGNNTLYICGTDEYGTATETKALAEGVTPKEICDKYHALHSAVYKWFNIDFDFFGRTTTKSQTLAAQSIFNNLYKNEKISQNRVEQLFCENCQRFLADRFVEGTCPHPGCRFEDARGDQCDSCGKLVNATELIEPRCKLCSQRPSIRGSDHLFLDLPKIETDLKNWMKSSSDQWSNNAKVICESWLRDGLKERCITRDLKWGTPVPLEGFKDKVFYVWFDAPIGYVSMTMEYTSQWELWWKNSQEVTLYQFMAKDNVPFHGVIFPSCLIGTKEPWTKVTHVMSTEYLNYEDGKFSKSRGVGVFGDQAKDTGISSDVWRFYLLFIRPESQDATFSWSDLQSKNNSELLNNLGNFINRSLKFVFQFYKGVVPTVEPNASDYKMIASVNKEIEKYINSLSSCKLRDGIRHILAISKIGNQYIQDNEPYKLIKPDRSQEDKQRGASVINIAVNIVALLTSLLQPFMPDLSKKVRDFLNNPPNLVLLPSKLQQFIKPGHKIKEPSPLITKISDEEVEKLRKQFAGSGSQVTSNKPKEAQPKKESTPISCQNGNIEPKIDLEEAKRIEQLVTEQGSKVRDLKAKGATKDVLGNEIELLLQLKEKLALAQGLDPNTVRAPPKKNKKK